MIGVVFHAMVLKFVIDEWRHVHGPWQAAGLTPPPSLLYADCMHLPITHTMQHAAHPWSVAGIILMSNFVQAETITNRCSYVLCMTVYRCRAGDCGRHRTPRLRWAVQQVSVHRRVSHALIPLFTCRSLSFLPSIFIPHSSRFSRAVALTLPFHL